MGLRKWLIVALIVLITLGIMTPALAWRAGKLGVSIGDVFFGNEFVIQKPTATLFHSQTAAVSDTEAFALAFPNTGVTDVLGNPAVAGLTLGLPTIAQTASETATATDTGFFKANWCYVNAGNPGAYELVPDLGAWHPVKSTAMAGAGVSWPYMNNAPLYGQSTMQFQPAITAAPDTSQISLAPASGMSGSSLLQPATVKSSLSGIGGNNSAGMTGGNATGAKVNNIGMQGTNLSANKTAANTTAVKAPEKAKAPNRDYKNMTKTDIKNMTNLEKMYRNANTPNTVPKTYKGTVDRPTTIAPMENPMDIIKPADKTKVIKDSGNMTKSGTHLLTKMWDL